LPPSAVAYEGVLGEGFAPLSLITNDAATAIAGADLVLIMAPTHAHEDVARTIAPHIAREQLVMAAPGHTLLLIPNAIRAAGGQLGTYCDSSSLPFICRKSAPDRIRITRVAQILYFAVFPGAEVEAVADMVRHVFPQIHPRRRCCARCSRIPTRSIIRPRCCSMSAGWNRRGATITTTTTASRPQSGA
jgi:opine dehydrogenase